MPAVEASGAQRQGGIVVVNKRVVGLGREISTLVIPDGDGTTIDCNVIPRSVRRGVHEVRSEGGVVALFTGRSPWAVQEKEQRALVTHGIYSTENGARLILGATEVHHPLAIEEVQAVLTEVDKHKDAVSYIVSFPQDTAKRPVRWVPTLDNAEELVHKYGAYADIISGPLSQFAQIIAEQKPGLLLIRPRGRSAEGLEFPDGINSVLSEQGVYNIGPAGVTKLTAAEELAGILQVPLERVIVAGNGPNDDHLQLTGATPVLVGSNPIAQERFASLPGVVRIGTVREFGDFLRDHARMLRQERSR